LPERIRLDMPKIVAIKEDWIKLGYKLFSESGETGLNVDKMSRILSCNKSSFYWHFKTKAEFIDCLVEYWVNIDTSHIITETNQQSTAKDKILKLIEIVFKKDSNLDFIFYLKRYSRDKKKIQNLIDKIDCERIDFMSFLLEEIGYNSETAKTKSLLFYKYLIGYHEMIRYKKQNRDYLQKVISEVNHFIKLKTEDE